MSSGTPSPQAPKVGEATSALSRNASSVRSFGGKNWSMSNTPSLRIGGCATWPISVPRSRLWPARHAVSIRFASSTCSREESGSEAIPTSARRLVTVPSISSRSVSASVSHESGGRVQRADDVDRRARLRAGRVDRHVCRVLQRLQPIGADALRREAVLPGLSPASPRSRPSERPAACASDGFTHGSKLAGARSGKTRARLPMSPFGSIASTGMPRRQRLLEEDDAEARSCRSRSCRR